jgi:hypothetical protein
MLYLIVVTTLTITALEQAIVLIQHREDCIKFLALVLFSFNLTVLKNINVLRVPPSV